jgi:hypothetical protein
MSASSIALGRALGPTERLASEPSLEWSGLVPVDALTAASDGVVLLVEC